jgi:lipid A 3-O-deacylase
MLRVFLEIAAASAVALSFVSTANAEDRYLFDTFGQIGKNADKFEMQLGLLSYDTGPFTHKEFDGAVLNAEILFPSSDFLYGIGSPRPHVGFDAALVDNPVILPMRG